jgi:hypothetical protein
VRRKAWIASIVVLVILGAGLGVPSVRVRVLAYLMGEHLYEELPTRYWRHQAAEYAKVPPADLRFVVRMSLEGFGHRLDGDATFIVPPPKPVDWCERLKDVLRLAPPKNDFRLFKSGDPAGSDVLVDLLDDSNPAIRQSAVRGLTKIGPPARAAAPSLTRLLSDAIDEKERELIQEALKSIHSD